MKENNELKCANDCVIDILESYLEFVEIMDRTLKMCNMPPKLQILADTLIAQRKNDWMPVLKIAKEHQAKEKKN